MTLLRRTRSERSKTVRSRTRALLLAAVVGALVLAGAVYALSNGTGSDALEAASPEPESFATAQADAHASESVSETAPAAEVPDLVGKTIGEATVILEALDLPVEVVEDSSFTEDASGDVRVVQAQRPEAGTLAGVGEAIQLVVGSDPGVPERTTAPTLGAVVVIDPGHQSSGDSVPEPIGPGASETKPRVTSGTRGAVTEMPEHEVVLQISMNLAARLEAVGVTVIMTRTTSDVSISNAERTRIANEAGAHLFVRVHADGSTDSSRAGISTLYPGKNQWTGPIMSESKRAASFVHDAVVMATGAASLGTVARTDLSGFNWSQVPSILVECGFMTNPVEDRLLSSPNYQDKLAEGMATGILSFLGE